MTKLIFILSAVFVVFVGFIRCYRWDSETNHGFTFGYHGEFNRVSNALASIPSTTITQVRENCDITLEEFGFTVTTESGEPVRIAIGEHDRIRRLSGKPLVQAPKKEIETKTKR